MSLCRYYTLNLFVTLPFLLPLLPVSPPVLSVPSGGQVVNVREGGIAELVCLIVDGKPRPPILWSRTEKDLLMPSGRPVEETADGRLRLKNVSRDMMGAYRCQTAPYNGLNIKRREAQVQLNVQCKCGPDYFSHTKIKRFQQLPRSSRGRVTHWEYLCGHMNAVSCSQIWVELHLVHYKIMGSSSGKQWSW